MLRNAVTGEVIPPRRDPTIFYRAVLEGCLNDIVFKSRAQQWCRRNHTTDPMDFLWWTLKPARDAGTLPLFNNVANAVAFALAVPHRPDLWKDE